MDIEEVKLNAREEFPFPFTPYSIQQDFMSKLYSTIEDGKLGIFESPTGTGKSLSVICGALSWLLDHEKRERQQLKSAMSKLESLEIDEGGDDWLNQQVKLVQVNRKKFLLQQQIKKIELKDEKIQKMCSKKKVKETDDKQYIAVKKHSGDHGSPKDVDVDASGNEDADILLEDAASDGEDDQASDEEEAEEEDEYHSAKVYFCSRTHSQLSQFVGEVQRSSFKEEIRLVSLASRQNYCINETVNKLKNISLINERCLDMQRSKKSRPTATDSSGKTIKKSRCSTAGCPHLKQRLVEGLRDEILTHVLDVESLVARGEKANACPYYATRMAIRDAQVVVVPYNTLLHKSTREACGIDLRGCVVIIDEAHNLLDTIGHIHSAEVTGQQLTHAYSQLVQYRDKYSTRFSATNLLHLNQLIFVVGKLIAMLGGKPGCNPVEASRKGVDTKLYSLSEFVLIAEIDNLNLYRLLAFCKKSKITHKLQGYSERYQPSVTISPGVKATQLSGIRAFLKEIAPTSNVADPVPLSPPQPSQPMSNNPLLPVISFMECLTNHSEDGRVVCARQASVGRGSLKYLLLNPAAHFSDVVREARSVIVAGGTMQPISEFTDQLFLACGADQSRVTQFSCGHVIPPENILPLVVTHGPSGKPFDFSYQQRDSGVMMNELGRLLVNMCNVVPAGVVCFFPSYDYEKLVFEHLDKTGVISKLQLRKTIFREPKRAGMVEQVLADYAASIDPSNHTADTKVNGALLFSVMGGKLSEGLNFSDDLGRCIIVVGLPYPNIKSPELQEKLNYLNNTLGPAAGSRHYENLCMKAVNQSIGRAVRHKDDYAAVLLLDQRYSRPGTIAGLPSWIAASLGVHHQFGPVIGQVCKFFGGKKK